MGRAHSHVFIVQEIDKSAKNEIDHLGYAFPPPPKAPIWSSYASADEFNFLSAFSATHLLKVSVFL
jgi:hypothetical protein